MPIFKRSRREYSTLLDIDCLFSTGGLIYNVKTDQNFFPWCPIDKTGQLINLLEDRSSLRDKETQY